MALVDFEAKRDVWQEILDSVREIKAGKGKRTNVEAKSYVVRVRCTTQLYTDPFFYFSHASGAKWSATVYESLLQRTF